MKSLLALLPLLAVVAAFDLLAEEWLAFKLQHGKQYASAAEERARRALFARSRLAVARHNQRHAQGLETFRLALNEFADLSPEEFAHAYNGFRARARPSAAAGDAEPAPSEPLPERMDWRTKGAVTAVKHQGACASCWAFSATGALEAQLFRLTGALVSLSEQNLLDCSQRYGNEACCGGNADDAFMYMHDEGIDTEADYPYEADNGPCRYKRSDASVPVVGFMDLPRTELALQQNVAWRGPVAIAMDAKLDSFRFYSEGVYYDEACSSIYVNHAMLVVGYGSDEVYGDYWLVKNSWGRAWGEHGYVRMARNRSNNCGIASYASIPVVGNRLRHQPRHTDD